MAAGCFDFGVLCFCRRNIANCTIVYIYVHCLQVTDIAEKEKLGHRLVRGCPVLEAEVIYAARNELCETAADFLAHRCRLAFLDTGACLQVLLFLIRIHSLVVLCCGVVMLFVLLFSFHFTFLVLGSASHQALPRVVELMGNEKGWSAHRKQAEVSATEVSRAMHSFTLRLTDIAS